MIALISKVLAYSKLCPLSRAQGTEHPQPLLSAQASPMQSSAHALADGIPQVCDSSTTNAHVTQHKQATHPTTPHAPCESKAVKNKDNKTLPIGRGGEGGFEMCVKERSGRIPTRGVFNSCVTSKGVK